MLDIQQIDRVYPDDAYALYPEGCQCVDDPGDCNWCRVYYGLDNVTATLTAERTENADEDIDAEPIDIDSLLDPGLDGGYRDILAAASHANHYDHLGGCDPD